MRILYAIIKFYFKRYSPRLRLWQYNLFVQFTWIRILLEGIKDELGLPEDQVEEAEAQVIHPDLFQRIQPVAHYRQYNCVHQNPLICPHAQESAPKKGLPGSCNQCGFPAMLAEKSEILGQKGRYRIEGVFSSRGVGRLYKAIQVQDGQAVMLKEYLLPTRYFSPREAKERQTSLLKVAGLALADGRSQDVRLVTPWEAIADSNLDRAYLITRGKLDTYQTIGSYLEEHGPMKSRQIRLVLGQALQTLEFLHSQKYRLPSGQVQQGIPHGSLTLESMLIHGSPEEFIVYLCDLALWERLFDPPQIKGLVTSDLNQDVIALGRIVFYLQAGRTVDKYSGAPLNPDNIDNWLTQDTALRTFILRMLELGDPFSSVAEARQVFLKLPPPPERDGDEISATEDEIQAKTKRAPLWLVILMAAGLVSVLVWLLYLYFRPAPRVTRDFLPCCFKDVGAVPNGNFTYAATRQGTWGAVLEQVALSLGGKPLEKRLQDFQPKLLLRYQPADSIDDAILKIWSNAVDFAIVPWYSEAPTPVEQLRQQLIASAPPGSVLPEPPLELTQQKIAYDGLLIFVPFSYARRSASLPSALAGKITYDQLRKLYTGQIINWKELGGPNLPVRLYIPAEPEAIQIFEQRVLETESNIARFRELVGEQIKPLPTFQLMRTLIQDFERAGVGSIAFGPLSKVFGQCSVYPLAVQKQGDQAAVQALTQDNGSAIDPNTNLCDAKGSYRPDSKLFQEGRYPLSYPLMVVYPRDNSRPPAGEKFAEMLRTVEGQRLLLKAGLVPFQTIPTN